MIDNKSMIKGTLKHVDNMKQPDLPYYEVIVQNVGKVHEGNSKQNALREFNDYASQSRRHYGRAAGEGVCLYENGEPIKEHTGRNNETDADGSNPEFQGYHRFHNDAGDEYGSFEVFEATHSHDDLKPGWYWWPCFSGCLPDGEPTGPFPTAEGAYLSAIND